MESPTPICDDDLQALEDSVLLDATGSKERLAAALARLPPEVRHQPRHLLVMEEITFTTRQIGRRRHRGQPFQFQRRRMTVPAEEPA